MIQGAFALKCESFGTVRRSLELDILATVFHCPLNNIGIRSAILA